jgi:hypothetical protein
MQLGTFTGDASVTPHLSTTHQESSAGLASRWFYLGMAAACAATVFCGFAPSFFLRPSERLPALAPSIVAHGIILTSWFVLFLAQTALVVADRTRLHRQLGLAALGIALLIVASSPLLAVRAAGRGSLPGDPLAFLLVILGDIVAFGVFVAAGAYYRRRKDTHRRLMLLATVSLLPPAVSRWPLAANHPEVIFVVLIVFIGAMLLHDRLALRRLHAVSLWGGLALLASGPLRIAISQTEAWHRVATWLIGR